MSLDESRTICSQETALKLEKHGWDVDKLIQSEVSAALRGAKDTPDTQPQDSEEEFAERLAIEMTNATLEARISIAKGLLVPFTKKQVLLGKVEQAKFIRANVESLLDVKWLDERIAELEQQLKLLDTSLGEENV